MSDDNTDTTPEPEDGQTFDAAYVRKLRAEAAEHRKARREAEEARTKLAEELDSIHRAADERDLADRLADVLADPRDLLVYVERDELTDDDGRIDLDAAEAKARELIEDKTHLAARPKVPLPSADQGARGGAKPEPEKPTAESVFARMGRM